MRSLNKYEKSFAVRFAKLHRYGGERVVMWATFGSELIKCIKRIWKRRQGLMIKYKRNWARTRSKHFTRNLWVMNLLRLIRAKENTWNIFKSEITLSQQGGWLWISCVRQYFLKIRQHPSKILQFYWSWSPRGQRYPILWSMLPVTARASASYQLHQSESTLLIIGFSRFIYLWSCCRAVDASSHPLYLANAVFTLWDACDSNKCELIKEILRRNPDLINEISPTSNETALFHATRYNFA